MAWPTREDGTNKRVGEMTPEERKEVFATAAKRTQQHFERPDIQAGLKEMLSDNKPVRSPS